ncbi:YitT family protein [Caldifermentibacillus hisashii]|uniref:YitT family protein n=1 Tax=Caldifermentibacillus hisashii TaxID=996558 RepID=UPI001C12060D|nr:YitT family protein [Caldifermentibacillus hisashii]MBU5344159.1 YitT family protein [Caldifermentibacillus hisashii]
MVLFHVKKFIIVIIGAFIFAFSMNYFLIPAGVYSSGFSGLSQLLSRLFSEYFNIHISVGIWLLLLNIPVTILGWRKVGKTFTLYSFISVIFSSLFLNLIPIKELSDDILLNAVFGGVIGAVGAGMTLRFGASTGGMDIIAVYLSRVVEGSVGRFTLILNSFIIISAGFLFGWEKSLYTLVGLFSSSKVIDILHTQAQKLTAMIVTKNSKDLKQAILTRLTRGATVVPAHGAYSDEGRDMLITVISRYELFELRKIIKEVDPKAFTNIVKTDSVIGLFRKD